MTIRPARVDEAELLTQLALRSKAVWGYDAEFMRRCEPLLRVRPEYIRDKPVFVAEADGAVLGFYALNTAKYDIELDLLFVEPAALRAGTGRALLTHALRTARELGFALVFVESDPDAEPFYLRLGARHVGSVTSTVAPDRELPLLAFDLETSV